MSFSSFIEKPSSEGFIKLSEKEKALTEKVFSLLKDCQNLSEFLEHAAPLPASQACFRDTPP